MHTQTIVVSGKLGDNNHVVMFDEIHNPIPFIKKQLKQLNIYDTNYQNEVSCLTCIEEVLELIENNNITDVQVYLVEKVNPKEL